MRYTKTHKFKQVPCFKRARLKMAVSFKGWSVLGGRQLLFLITFLYFCAVRSHRNTPTVVAESTILIKNAFIQKCFAYEVKIFAFPDALGHDGLESAVFELYDGYLPKGAVTRDIGYEIGTKGQVLCLPIEEGCHKKSKNSRTGVFRATLTANSETEEFIAIVNPDSDLKPVSPVTQTISQGETAYLEVDYSTPYEIVWTYDGPSPNKWKGELKIKVDQPGIYQVFSKKARDERLTFRVIKRACVDGMYGANCDMPCHVDCGDGKGVCDDVDGSCICTPGFTGVDCSTAESVPIGFGTDGTLFCERNGVANPRCKGIIFCRRGLFGCSCMKGFGGPRCTEACPTDMYGHNCEFGGP